MPIHFILSRRYYMKMIHYLCGILLIGAVASCASNPTQRKSMPTLEALRDSIEQDVYKKIQAVVVYQKGEILVEEYYNGMTKDGIHDARSVGKSITSALLGIAIDEGHIESLDLPLSDFFNLEEYENYSDQKAQITLRDLVTMSSNFDGNDDDPESPGNEENMYDKPNWVQWALNLPLDSTRKSGESWAYFTAGTILIGDILNRAVPNGLEQYSKEKLFDPLGNQNYSWSFTPQEVPSTAGNFRTTALGFADFGQMYLNRGNWKGQRIISEQWIKESLTPHIKTSYDPRSYGYFWWTKDLSFDDAIYHMAYCSGNGGNKIYLIKELDAVIVILASAYGTNYMHRQAREITQQFLLPIIRNAAL